MNLATVGRNRLFRAIIFALGLLLPAFVNVSAHAGKCYESYDLGDLRIFTIGAALKENDVITGEGGKIAVVKWIDTGLFVIGGAVPIVASMYNDTPGAINEWYPWGSNRSFNCIDKRSSESVGYKVTGQTKMMNYLFSNDHKNYGCRLKHGLGLYGLIAKNSAEPNTRLNAEYPPEDFFSTFHMGMNRYVTIYDDRTEMRISAVPEIVNGKITGSFVPLPRGRLFLKILDTHYNDNAGSYTVTFEKGVFKPGFFTKLMKAYKTALAKTTERLTTSVRGNVAQYVMPLIYFSVVVQSILFLMGLIRATHTELIIRLFKISLVLSILSESAYNRLIGGTLVAFIIGGQHTMLDGTKADGLGFGDAIAGMISTYYATGSISEEKKNLIDAAVINNDTEGVSDNMMQMSVYDTVIERFTSSAIQAKVWGLLFTSKFYFIFLLYLYMYLFTIMIFKIVLMLMSAYLRLSLLVIVLPLFLLFLLFKTTQDLFQTWIKNATASAMLIILVALYTIFMFKMMGDNFFDLFRYKVCKMLFFFVVPSSESSLLHSTLTLTKYVKALILLMIFSEIQEKLAGLADNFTGVFQGGNAGFYNTAVKTAQEFTMGGTEGGGLKGLLTDSPLMSTTDEDGKKVSRLSKFQKERMEDRGKKASEKGGLSKFLLNSASVVSKSVGLVGGIIEYAKSETAGGANKDMFGLKAAHSSIDKKMEKMNDEIKDLKKQLEDVKSGPKVGRYSDMKDGAKKKVKDNIKSQSDYVSKVKGRDKKENEKEKKELQKQSKEIMKKYEELYNEKSEELTVADRANLDKYYDEIGEIDRKLEVLNASEKERKEMQKSLDKKLEKLEKFDKMDKKDPKYSKLKNEVNEIAQSANLKQFGKFKEKSKIKKHHDNIKVKEQKKTPEEQKKEREKQQKAKEEAERLKKAEENNRSKSELRLDSEGENRSNSGSEMEVELQDMRGSKSDSDLEKVEEDNKSQSELRLDSEEEKLKKAEEDNRSESKLKLDLEEEEGDKKLKEKEQEKLNQDSEQEAALKKIEEDRLKQAEEEEKLKKAMEDNQNEDGKSKPGPDNK